jgi:hypothetical protein
VEVNLIINNDYSFRPAGFCLAVMMILKMKPGAVLWLAPPCGSWVWLSRWSTGRGPLSVLGKTYIDNIAAQNALVGRLCYIIALATKRNVYWVIEQPSSSLMWNHPRLERLMAKLGQTISQAFLEMGAWHMLCRKDTFLKGHAPHLEQMQRRMSSKQKMWMKTNGHKINLATRREGKSTGDEDGLKASQSYPLLFGIDHALAYKSLLPCTDDPPSFADCLADDISDSDMSSDDSCLEALLATHTS